MKRFITIIGAVLGLLVLAGCDRAPANVATLQTTDCGVTWTVIKAGQRIPTTVGTCSYNTVLPDYPMQGEAEFMAQFAGNVLVKVRTTFDYSIVDPILFLGEAKFLGKQRGSAAAAADGSNMAGIETAENQVIDKRIREATTSMTQKQDIVEFNSAKFEDELQKASNAELQKRGVVLNSMTFVMIPEEQTRQAIDAATAMNVYKNKGLEQFGQQIAIARAGAARIVVEPAQPAPTTEK